MERGLHGHGKDMRINLFRSLTAFELYEYFEPKNLTIEQLSQKGTPCFFARGKCRPFREEVMNWLERRSPAHTVPQTETIDPRKEVPR